MIASLRLDGAAAPMVIEGASDGAVFRAYVKHVLLPTLQAGDIGTPSLAGSKEFLHLRPHLLDRVEVW